MGVLLKKFFGGEVLFFINHILYSSGPVTVSIHTISCIKYSCRELTGTLYLVPVFNKYTQFYFRAFSTRTEQVEVEKGVGVGLSKGG